MKRARTQSPERAWLGDATVAHTEQRNQTSHMSPQQIIAFCNSVDNAAARHIALAAKELLSCKQKEMRSLCADWHVQRKPQGQSERTVAELKAELQTQLAQHAHTLRQALACITASSFCLASATRATVQNLQQIPGKHRLLARVIDHTCCSEDTISHAIVKMLQAAEMQVQADLTSMQERDVGGYIACDVVQQLQHVVVSESDSWWSATLSDYPTHDCLRKGQEILQSDQRILDRHQVKELVFKYCNRAVNEQHLIENWWAGAVTLEEFLPAVIETAYEMLLPSCRSQRRWRVWIVNTQTSQNAGGHWFTVAIGVPQASHQEKLRTLSATQRPLCTSSVDVQAVQLPAIHEWARMNADKPDVAKWIAAWREWERLEDTCSHTQYRSFCSQHGLKRKKEAEESGVYKKALRQSLIDDATLMRTMSQKTIHEYFDRAKDK